MPYDIELVGSAITRSRELSLSEAQHLARVLDAVSTDPNPDGVTKYHLASPVAFYWQDATLRLTYRLVDGTIEVYTINSMEFLRTNPGGRL